MKNIINNIHDDVDDDDDDDDDDDGDDDDDDDDDVLYCIVLYCIVEPIAFLSAQAKKRNNSKTSTASKTEKKVMKNIIYIYI